MIGLVASRATKKRATFTLHTCSAKRRSDGLPCQVVGIPPSYKCKWHGGKSLSPAAPKSPAAAGIAKARDDAGHVFMLTSEPGNVTYVPLKRTC
jgi:hypothetical protein